MYKRQLYDISFEMTAGSNGTAHSRSQSNTQKLDHSVLRSSIDVSVTGMKQALLALENGNKEVCLTIIYILDILEASF